MRRTMSLLDPGDVRMRPALPRRDMRGGHSVRGHMRRGMREAPRGCREMWRCCHVRCRCSEMWRRCCHARSGCRNMRGWRGHMRRGCGDVWRGHGGMWGRCARSPGLRQGFAAQAGCE